MLIRYEKEDKKIDVAEVETFEECVETMKKYLEENGKKLRYLQWIFFTSEEYIDEVRVDYGSWNQFFWLSELPKTFRDDLREYSNKYIESRNAKFI